MRYIQILLVFNLFAIPFAFAVQDNIAFDDQKTIKHFTKKKNDDPETLKIIKRLSEAIQIATVSDTHDKNPKLFADMINFFQHNYPSTYAALGCQTINYFSLLCRWNGSDKNGSNILFSAHLDVVNASNNESHSWTYPPFSGAIADGYIWGRGTLDVKSVAVQLFEAIDKLMASGFQPSNTIFFGFGHDEESGGQQGAQEISRKLNSDGITLSAIFDEGGMLAKNVFPSVDKTVALIGTSEKSSINIELTVSYSNGGHSSIPFGETTIGILAQAIQRVESSHFPIRWTKPSTQLFANLAPHMGWFKNMLLSNLWIFDSIVTDKLTENPAMNAMLRNTAVATIISGGERRNSLPMNASAIINLRLLPNESITSVITMIEQIIDDPRIFVTLHSKDKKIFKPTISDTKSSYFSALSNSISEVYPDTIISPWLTIASTDSRHYSTNKIQILRFAPYILEKADLNRIHGVDERIAISTYLNGIVFYETLLKNLKFRVSHSPKKENNLKNNITQLTKKLRHCCHSL